MYQVYHGLFAIAISHESMDYVAMMDKLVSNWIILVVIAILSYFGYRRFSYPNLIGLNKKLVVITGCDSGFGFGAAKQLLIAGADVIALVYSEAGFESMTALGVKHVIRADLSSPSAIERACEEIYKICCDGRSLYALVHNAGTVSAGAIDFLTVDAFRRVFEVNFFAAVSLTALLLPLIKRQSQAAARINARKRIILMSSVCGLVSLPCNAPYDASKFAIEAYADNLRVEQSFWNIEVSVINPSTMRTPLAMNIFETERRSWEEKMQATAMATGAAAAASPVSAGQNDTNMMTSLEDAFRWSKEWPKESVEFRIENTAKDLEKIAEDPSVVVKDLLHALTARKPKRRYLSGTLAKTMFYFLWVCPESWSYAFKRSLVNPRPCVLQEEDKIEREDDDGDSVMPHTSVS